MKSDKKVQIFFLKLHLQDKKFVAFNDLTRIVKLPLNLFIIH